MTPMNKWFEAAKIHRPRNLPPNSMLTDLVGQVEIRKLDRGSVRIFGFRYTSSRLSRYANQHGNCEVTVKFDPQNISAIRVIDMKQNQVFSAEARGEAVHEYVRNLPLYCHKAIRKYALEDRHSDEGKLRIRELLAAKAELQEIADGMLKGRKNKSRGPRVARWLEMMSQTHEPDDLIIGVDDVSVDQAIASQMGDLAEDRSITMQPTITTPQEPLEPLTDDLVFETHEIE